jgi:hydroxyacyl-ACP dehydratase HTD2-like protein with hotdog domain
VGSKQGDSGSLVFLCVMREIANPLGLAIGEEHDIAYLSPLPLAGEGPGERERFSAPC